MDFSKIVFQIIIVSITGSGLALGILLIKAIFRQKLSAKFHYYVWFLLLLRLLIPITIQTPFNINFVSNNYSQYKKSIIPSSTTNDKVNTKIDTKINNKNQITSKQDENIINNNFVNKNSTNTVFKFDYRLATIIWLIGIIIFLMYMLVVNLVLAVKIKKNHVCNRKDINELLEKCKFDMNVKSKVILILDNNIKSPALCGLIKPKILISPAIINTLSLEEIKYVLLHELSHLKRKDLLISLVGMLIQAIYWFNPIIWYAIYKMKQDCELACDAAVLSKLSKEENKKYGQTIINILNIFSKSHWVPGTIGFTGKYNRRRIIMITLFKKQSTLWTIVALLLTILTGCSSLLNANDSNKNSSSKQRSVNTSTSSATSTNLPTSSPKENEASGKNPSPTTTQNPSQSIVYKNTQYGFTFTLPSSWNGYLIVTSKWDGTQEVDSQGNRQAVSGPRISIRHPSWTSQNPRQDIPIMILTLAQWDLIIKEKLFIGAGPVNPTELGRNSKYIFALPARYNYSFLTGFEEVEKILNGKPLKGIN